MSVTENLNMTLWSRASAQDKEVSGSVAVFRGRTSLNVWRKGSGKPVASVALTTETLRTISILTDSLVAQGPKAKFKSKLQEWNRDEKKFVDKGYFVVGLDEKMTPYFGISSQSGTYSFPIYMKRPNFLSDEAIDQTKGAALTLKSVCDDLRDRALLLESLSNEKRQQGGGNGGGSNYNRNNNNGGGNASAKLDDDIPF